jgi:hypothetical protein
MSVRNAICFVVVLLPRCSIMAEKVFSIDGVLCNSLFNSPSKDRCLCNRINNNE